MHNINLAWVLAQRANGDTVGAVAMKVLNQNVGNIGLERDTIFGIVSKRRSGEVF